MTTYPASLDFRHEDVHELIFVHPGADPEYNSCGERHQGSQGGKKIGDRGQEELGSDGEC